MCVYMCMYVCVCDAARTHTVRAYVYIIQLY